MAQPEDSAAAQQVQQAENREKYESNLLKQYTDEQGNNLEKLKSKNIEGQWLQVAQKIKYNEIEHDMQQLLVTVETETSSLDILIGKNKQRFSELQSICDKLLEKYKVAIDQIKNKHNATISELHHDRIAQLESIQALHDKQVKNISEKHIKYMTELQHISIQMGKIGQKGRVDQKTEDDTYLELVKNRYMEDIHKKRHELSETTKIFKSRIFDMCKDYRDKIEDQAQEYKKLHDNSEKHATAAESNKLQAEKLHNSINEWKTKVINRRAEREQVLNTIKKQKDQLQKYHNATKNTIQNLKNREISALEHLSINAHNCVQQIQKNIKFGEEILRLQTQCMRYEYDTQQLQHLLNEENVQLSDVDGDAENIIPHTTDDDILNKLRIFIVKYNSIYIECSSLRISSKAHQDRIKKKAVQLQQLRTSATLETGCKSIDSNLLCIKKL